MTKQTPAETVAALLADIDDDLNAAVKDHEAAVTERDALVARLNQDARPTMQALQDAQADLAVVKRLDGRLPKQAYDKRFRAAQLAYDAAASAQLEAAEAAVKQVNPLNHRVAAAAKRHQDLQAERQAHARLAKAFRAE